MDEIHEFTMLRFKDGVDAAEQLATMRTLGAHLSGCEGLRSREFFGGEGDGRWVEHVAWASREDLEASARLDDDPKIAGLFERFDAGSTFYLRGPRIESGTAGAGEVGAP
jgi:hypothetical protein